ncbi:MAG: hypothetical protein QW096_13500 [Thermofilaceae archaeon]
MRSVAGALKGGRVGRCPKATMTHNPPQSLTVKPRRPGTGPCSKAEVNEGGIHYDVDLVN